MAEEEERRGEVMAARYVNIREQINAAISRSLEDPFLRSPLEDLQKTVLSMEPMVNDIQRSLDHIFTDRFLPLLQQVEDLIRRFHEIKLAPASPRVGSFKAGICRLLGIQLPAASYKKELENIRERLKNFVRDYVKEELDELDRSEEAVDEDAVKQMLRSLGRKIRNEASSSSKFVFQKINIILRSLDTEEFQGTPQLLLLLKEVKLLVKFLNGDNGLDIPTLLLPRERALREFVTDNVVLSQLMELDRQDEKQQREKEMWMDAMYIFIGVLMIAILLEFPKEQQRDLVAVVTGIIVVIFAVSLTMDIYRHVRLEQSHAHERQSSNSNKPCCGGFGLLISIVAVVGVVVVAIAVAVTDEPKKYDIFLNFRGSDDIRYTVAGVFHRSLEKANFSTFFDERSARKTKRFLKEIESAISTSVGAITIFSEYYGESEYCLDELLLILEREKTHRGYIIRPIFYDVEPDDLTNPESKFGKGLQKHYMTQLKDKVEEWKEALDTVILIGGDVHKRDRHHLDDLVHRVVEDFKNQLGNYKWGAEKNTIQRWRSFIKKMAPPINLRIGNLKLSVDLWCFKFDVTMIPAS